MKKVTQIEHVCYNYFVDVNLLISILSKAWLKFNSTCSCDIMVTVFSSCFQKKYKIVNCISVHFTEAVLHV